MIQIDEIRSKSLLRKHHRVDSWFLSHYGMNLYRGCQHDCSYCDGRSETYWTECDFGTQIGVKVNAPDLLSRETDPNRKRKPLPVSYFMIGGGLSDAWQPAEKKYKIARDVLEVLLKREKPVHILTKSVLVRRDLDLIAEINKKAGAIISFSFSCTDDDLSRRFEPGTSFPSERLSLMREIRDQGIPTGAYLMPVIPMVTDRFELMESGLKDIKEAGSCFVVFGALTLKEGRQKDRFMKTLKLYKDDFEEEYKRIYRPNKLGMPSYQYRSFGEKVFRELALKYKIPVRIPEDLFPKNMASRDRLVVLLDHMSYMMDLKGLPNGFGKASWKCLEYWKSRRPGGPDVPRMGSKIDSVIKEILETGTCRSYQDLYDEYT